MKITFLGTGTSQGIPVIGCECPVCTSLDFRDKRLRTSVFVEVNGLHLVVDTGPDFRQQMLSNNIKKLDAVLFTHEHKDHTAGMDDVRSFNFMQKKDMPVFADERVIAQLKQEFAYVFAENKYPGVPQVEIHEIENKTFQIEGQNIQPIKVMHYKLPVFGFRVEDFVYVTDVNGISSEEKVKMKSAKVLVLGALQKTEHISHFTLGEALELIDELKPGVAYLTHVSHRMGKHKDVSGELPENVFFAYDGLELTIDA